MTDGSRDRERGGWVVQGEEKHAGSRFPRDAASPSPPDSTRPVFILDVQTSRGFLWKPSRVESRWMECGGSARNGLGPAAGTKRVQSCGKSSCVALDPLVAACRFSWIISGLRRVEKASFFSLGRDISLANAEEEREEGGRKESQRGPRAFEGKEMPNPGTQTRTQARTQRAKRDERDERVGELIRRQECRPEETPTTVYTRFQTRCWGATVDHGHARLAMASTRLRTFPFPEGKIWRKFFIPKFATRFPALALKFLHLIDHPLLVLPFFHSCPDRLFSNI